MKNLTLAFLLLLVSFSCNDDDDDIVVIPNTDYFAVANRGSGTITIYNADTQDKLNTITIDGADAAPTYVVYSSKRDLIYTADFNNQKVIAYSGSDFSKTDEFTTGTGSFHMWLNDISDQLWVNNISEKTTSVIDLNTGNSLATLPLPASIDINTDTAQHDVIISPDGNFAYVSIFSQIGTNYVLQYNTTTFELMNTVLVGGDPHLTVTTNNLYILSQDESNITEYNFSDLTSTGNSGTMDNAHGVTVGSGTNIFITNISERKIGSYDTANQITSQITNATATSGAAHNLAFNPNSNILALTISGNTSVEFFAATGSDISFISSDNSGDNPFGIVYIDR